jgi:hypothetical protein
MFWVLLAAYTMQEVHERQARPKTLRPRASYFVGNLNDIH